MARRSPSQLSGRPLVNAITARSKGPGASAPKEEVPLSVNPAVREFVIASAVAKYASFREHTVPQRAHVFRVYLNGSGHVRRLLAETGGFEPPIRCDPYNGLANRRLQPLGHVSGDGNPYRTGISASTPRAQRAQKTRVRRGGSAQKPAQQPPPQRGDVRPPFAATPGA